MLERLEPDAEALIVNRTDARAPVRDRPHRPVLPPRRARSSRAGQGITGGQGGRRAIAGFFDDLRARTAAPDVSVDGTVAGGPATSSRRSPCSTSSRSRTPPTPTLRFDLHVDDPAGRDVHTIALRDADPDRPGAADLRRRRRARGSSSCSGRRSGGRRRRRRSAGRTSFALVPGFTGATSFALEVPCTYDLEVAASKYFYSLPGGEVPLSFLFNGMVLYRRAGDRLAGRAGPLELHGPLADAGRRLAGA